MNDIKELLKKLQIEYKNIELYSEALTHRSFLNENRNVKISHNERLEFLGDAVLELIISEFLFEKYPDRPEGDLTSFRAALVKTESLAQISRELELGMYLRMSKGEEVTGGRDKDFLLANTFEAVLGAIYLDLGYIQCKNLVYQVLIPKLEGVVENRSDIDFKTKFQELAQAKYKVTPIYKVLSEQGPDHDKSFTMGVYIHDKEFGKGQGSSKQRAEEEAAQQALEIIDKKRSIE